MRKSALIIAIAPLVFAIAACGENSGQTASTPGTPGSTPAAPATRNRWASIKSRGQVICDVSGEVPGFSFVGTDGKYSGIDVDICRAIAAALFDNPDAVESNLGEGLGLTNDFAARIIKHVGNY